jgi:hypothetical protein
MGEKSPNLVTLIEINPFLFLPQKLRMKICAAPNLKIKPHRKEKKSWQILSHNVKDSGDSVQNVEKDLFVELATVAISRCHEMCVIFCRQTFPPQSSHELCC